MISYILWYHTSKQQEELQDKPCLVNNLLSPDVLTCPEVVSCLMPSSDIIFDQLFSPLWRIVPGRYQNLSYQRNLTGDATLTLNVIFVMLRGRNIIPWNKSTHWYDGNCSQVRWMHVLNKYLFFGHLYWTFIARMEGKSKNCFTLDDRIRGYQESGRGKKYK